MSLKTIAILLIVLGIIAFAYQGITFKTPDKTYDMGPVHVTTEKTNHIPLPPVVGAIALVGGVALLITSSRRGA
jgi:hypothetical protein